MKKSISRGMALVMAVCLAFIFCGCGKGSEAQSARGLKDGELFQIGDVVCTSSEALVFVLSQKSRYEAGYGAEIWDVKVGEQTFEEYMQENLQDFLVKMKCMELMARQYEVELVDEDEKRISQAASVYLEGLPDQVKKDTGIDKKTAEGAFRDYYTASLLVEKLTADVSAEISEDEARVITIQQIFLSTGGLDDAAKEEKRTKAQNLLSQIQAGSEFSLLAKTENESEVFERELSRGEEEEPLEDVAFALSGEEVGPVVETADGFYLIRCVNNYDETKTAQNKETLERKQKADRFYEYYDVFVGDVTALYNESAWESIDYRKDYEPQATDFYTVYSQYFPS